VKIAPLASIIIILSPPDVCIAQWIDLIQTESDWEDLYSEGYFDYDSYRLYRDLAEGDSVKDESQYLESVLGNPLTEIRLSGNSPSKGNVVTTAAGQSQGLASGRIKSGHKVRLNENSGYYLMDVSLRQMQFGYKGRNNNNNWQTERRSLRYTNSAWDITAGNYTADCGLGLTIGRFDYRPISSSRQSTINALFPDNSYYNGLKVIYRENQQLCCSVKKYGNASKSFWGGYFSRRLQSLELGIALGATLLSADSYRKSLGVGSIYAANESLGVRAELAYGESGIGFTLKTIQKGFDIRVWRFDKSYINLQSSGYAYPDYISYVDESTGLVFRQVQAGESGMLVEKGIILGRVDLDGISEVWKRTRDDAIAGDYSLWARYRAGDRAFFSTKLSAMKSPESRRNLMEFATGVWWFAKLTLLSSLYVGDNNLKRQRSFSQVYCEVSRANVTSFNGRVRFRYNGDIEYYIEERTTVFPGTILNATYRWQNASESRMGPLFLTLERVF